MKNLENPRFFHEKPKFLQMRGRKTLLIELPEDSAREKEAEMSPGEMRTELLKRGINPYKEAQPRVWNEAQVTFQSICEWRNGRISQKIAIFH